MTTTVSINNNGDLCLGGSLAIYDVEELCQTLLKHLQEQAELILDLSEIAECDAAGAQLLCAARSGAAIAGKRCAFRQVSAVIATCFSDLGLSHNLIETNDIPQ